MKKEFMKNVTRVGFLGVFSILFASCGSYSGIGYEDGIYGESAPRYAAQEPRYERPKSQQEERGSYKAYLQQKANDFQEFDRELKEPRYTPFADVENYRTPENQSGYKAGWGENPSQSSVTIYNNYGYGGGFYDPYWDWNYRYNYYWGSSAWGYPFYSNYYGYDYYHPYRSGWSFSIGIGYPYYGGYYGRYYAPYYPYYGYGGDYYYGRVYRDNRNYSYTNGRRGDDRRYENYNNGTYRGSTSPSTSPYYQAPGRYMGNQAPAQQPYQRGAYGQSSSGSNAGSTQRSYGNSSNSNNYNNQQRTPQRIYRNNQYNSNSSDYDSGRYRNSQPQTQSYERSNNYSSPSSGSYSSPSSGNYGSGSSSGAGTTRRSY